ncbi:programmed cell death protein 7 [Plectropomus leopardus]|uniref:programmed cell death protein 7 n=1 Tax=Plectropomus leopardus TaxID=160734 RepID=UPI001C4B5749|nr:programmed cell death protein 7 [Plectropomus leopardus]
MENFYHHAPADTQQPPVYNGGYLEPPYRPPQPHDPPQPDLSAPQWAPSPGYDAHTYGYNNPAAAPGVYGGPRFPPPYGFDPSVPPPPFPPPGHFPGMVPAPPVNSRGASFHTPQFSQAARYDGHKQPEGYSVFPLQDDRSLGTTAAPPPEDEASLQRTQDQQWLSRFLQNRNKSSSQTQQPPRSSAPDLRPALYRAAELLSRLVKSCETLRDNLEDECVWTDCYSTALNVKNELQDKLRVLSDIESLERFKAKVSRVSQRRARRLRARKRSEMEQELREERISEKEAAIDKWRMQKIHEVEEKKKERELKLAADSVLCEVRKKQADVKRMQDVLRSLEKLRRLRKEAASRKGIVTEPECDEAFSSRLEQLRSVMKKRTAVYSTEEKALMVMLEGEQEEERRREREKRLKKERERHLQRKRRVEAMLFGDELPAHSVLQPFREYYFQAERSLHALLQIRREWDVFVVPADHPDGSAVPQSWILPDAPSDQAWASALQTTDAE